MAYIELKKVKKEYSMGEVKISALKNCSFDIEKGEFCVILGPSGAGKTTVLNIIGGMDSADSGAVIIDGAHVEKYKKKTLVKYRRYDVGFVFQFYNLIQNLTAIENVELATQLNKNALKPHKILDLVGLGDRIHNFPAQLSGGEQQRVSVARAIAKNPKLLLCDEPTGALDSVTGKRIINLLKGTCKKLGMTTVVITHNSIIADTADRVIRIKNGEIISVTTNAQPKGVDALDW